MSVDETSTTLIPAETPAPAPASTPPTWEPLSVIERRLLGVLIEKQRTSKTAEADPLTLNARHNWLQPEDEP